MKRKLGAAEKLLKLNKNQSSYEFRNTSLESNFYFCHAMRRHAKPVEHRTCWGSEESSLKQTCSIIAQAPSTQYAMQDACVEPREDYCQPCPEALLDWLDLGAGWAATDMPEPQGILPVARREGFIHPSKTFSSLYFGG